MTQVKFSFFLSKNKSKVVIKILIFFFHILGLASTYPEPQDKRKWLQDQLYNFNYASSLPVTWAWPRMPYIKTRELNPKKLFGDKSN